MRSFLVGLGSDGLAGISLVVALSCDDSLQVSISFSSRSRHLNENFITTNSSCGLGSDGLAGISLIVGPSCDDSLQVSTDFFPNFRHKFVL